MNWYKLSQSTFDFSAPGIREAKIGHATLIYQVLPNGEVVLSSLRVPQRRRGSGDAKAALEAFTSALDQAGAQSELAASPLDRKTHTDKLVNLYRRYGYEPSGERANPVGDPMMRRQPKI